MGAKYKYSLNLTDEVNKAGRVWPVYSTDYLEDDSDATYPYYVHNRFVPIETFVTRAAELVHSIDPNARISSKRNRIDGSPYCDVFALTLECNGHLSRADDPDPYFYNTAAETHRNNVIFLERAQCAVRDFARHVLLAWPSLEVPLVSELGRLENRLRANCHDIMRCAHRRQMACAKLEAS
ncbi:hypothetical protein [Noviherbaspirillum sp.]|uniref:hypothetical protein n=1 Tax=Noviherbaspirillum sp. TaxID=1926288 RepID=UPI002FE138D5